MNFIDANASEPELLFLPVNLYQIEICKARVIYNSTIFSNEKRNEWFDKLEIKNEDLLLWSRVFDQQYPLYKNIHKFFGQIE